MMSTQTVLKHLRAALTFPNSRKDLAQSLLVVAGVFLAGQLGLRITGLHPPVSPVWPPTGVAIDMSFDARKRARMSLRLEPAISRVTGNPMRRAAQADRMLPKLPVGTLNATSRSGAPSASAAAT